MGGRNQPDRNREGYLPAPYNLAPPDPVFTLPDPRRRKSSSVPLGGGKMILRRLRKAAQVFDNRDLRRLRRRSGRQERPPGRRSTPAIPDQRHAIPVHDVFSPLVQGSSPCDPGRNEERACHPRRSEAEIALVIPDGAKRRSGTADDIPHVPPGQPAWAEPGDGRRPLRSSDSRRGPRGKPCLLCNGSLAPGSAQAGCPGGQRKRVLQPSRPSASLRPG